MAMVPHERSLVEKMQGKPFALLGVNTDPSKEDLKEAQERHNITWRSFWDERKRIARKFNVSAFPTLFLLNHEGVIRQIYLGAPDDKALERDLEQVISESQAAPKS
jgi:peroxiredoxin